MKQLTHIIRHPKPGEGSKVKQGCGHPLGFFARLRMTDREDWL